jgi:hypothetical protein
MVAKVFLPSDHMNAYRLISFLPCSGKVLENNLKKAK